MTAGGDMQARYDWDLYADSPGVPSAERMRRGPVAVVECIEEIPCDPCETGCAQGAITIGTPITRIPHLDEELCTGCGHCIAVCPGQAIFVVDMSLPDGKATVSVPYEFLPLPEKGQTVTALDRSGTSVGEAEVVRVADPKAYDHTPVVTLRVPVEAAMVVRHCRA
ncbi:MAG: 4Fe-4S binding protein [Armatimonadota bacterium]